MYQNFGEGPAFPFRLLTSSFVTSILFSIRDQHRFCFPLRVSPGKICQGAQRASATSWMTRQHRDTGQPGAPSDVVPMPRP
jgi:hypothetical protein